MKFNNIVKQLVILILISMSVNCAAVSSGDLKSTKAEDLKISAYIYEYDDSDLATVSAQMQTVNNNVAIEFTQGESLIASSDAETGLSNLVYLSSNDLINLDRYYDGSVPKVFDQGQYHVTYKDSEGAETTADVDAYDSPSIIAPIAGDFVSPEGVLITWDPQAYVGSLQVKASYSRSGAAGFITQDVSNTGSYFLPLTENFSGSGDIQLIHTVQLNAIPVFEESFISMKNISRRNVTYSSVLPMSNLSYLTTKDDALNQCALTCNAGQEAKIILDGEEFNCCTNSDLQ